MQNKKLQKLQEEVVEFYAKIKLALCPEEDKKFNDDYLGYRIFFGKFIENPKVLFIGFNPGSSGGCIEKEDTQPQDFEYYDEDYPLANNARDVFKKLNKFDWFENDLATKINIYFLISYNMTVYYKLMGKLAKHNLKYPLELEDISKKWTKEIVEMINPEYIICEGVGTFRVVSNLLNAENVETNIHNCFMSLLKEKQIKIFGISRVRSNYKNKNGVIELLQKEMI